ncbi:unnamed protein product [Ectocarpus sp. 12 AP-2014]
MESRATIINVLNTTGIVTIERGYDILADIKKVGGLFRPQPVGDNVEPKSWIVKAGTDERARTIAKHLKNSARRSGLHAQTFALRVSKRNRDSLSDEGLLSSPKKSKYCEEILTSDEGSDYVTSDEEDNTAPAKKRRRSGCSRHDGTDVGQQKLTFASATTDTRASDDECSQESATTTTSTASTADVSFSAPRKRGRPRKEVIDSSDSSSPPATSARGGQAASCPATSARGGQAASRPSPAATRSSSVAAQGGTSVPSRVPRQLRNDEASADSAPPIGPQDADAATQPLSQRRRIITDSSETGPAGAPQAQAAIPPPSVDHSQRGVHVPTSGSTTPSGQSGSGGAGGSGPARRVGRPADEAVFDPVTGTFADKLVNSAAGNPIDFSITVTNATSGNVPHDTHPAVCTYFDKFSDRYVASIERGPENSNLHIQAVATLSINKKFDNNNRLNAAMRKHLRDHAALDGRERFKIVIKPLENTQTFDCMVGYCSKDEGRSHYKTKRKGVTRTEANVALAEYRVRQRRVLTDNRTDLGKKNFWPAVLRFKQENVRALAVSPQLVV